MNLLIVSATEQEIAPFLRHLKASWSRTPEGKFFIGNCVVEILITGVGMHRMSYALGRSLLSGTFDLSINAGIAGAFPGKAEPGEVVHVISEIFADLGAEDTDGSFLSLADLSLDEDIPTAGEIRNSDAAKYHFLRPVHGITVNTTHGYTPSIEALVKRYDPDVESMEGGAFFYCCMKSNIPFIEIRSISNIVSQRDRSTWDIPLAVDNLCNELEHLSAFFAGT